MFLSWGQIDSIRGRSGGLPDRVGFFCFCFCVFPRLCTSEMSGGNFFALTLCEGACRSHIQSPENEEFVLKLKEES